MPLGRLRFFGESDLRLVWMLTMLVALPARWADPPGSYGADSSEPRDSTQVRSGGDRLQSLVEILRRLDADKSGSLESDEIPDIARRYIERWAKLAANCMMNAVAGLTGLSAHEIRSRTDTLPVIVALGAEVIRVALAQGVTPGQVLGIDAARVLEADEGMSAASVYAELASFSEGSLPSAQPSLLSDVMAGRATEIRDLNGFAAERGRERGVAAPLCETVVLLVEEIERGDREPDVANLDMLRRLLAER